MDSDKQYLELFLGEVKEHLSKLDDLLLHIEKNPEDKGAIEEAFRELHTIKGDSATVGLTEVARLAHEAEDLISGLRKGEVKVGSKVIEDLFRYLDKIADTIEIEKMGMPSPDRAGDLEAKKAGGKRRDPEKIRELEKALETVEKGVSKAYEALAEGEDLLPFLQKENSFNPEVDAGDLRGKGGNSPEKEKCQVSEIEGGNGNQSGGQLKDAMMSPDGTALCETPPDQKGSSSGKFLVRISSEIEPPLRPVRAFAIMKALFEAGDLERIDPPNEKLAAGEFGNEIIAEIVTRDVNALVEALKGIQGIRNVDHQKMDEPKPSNPNMAEKSALIDRLVSLVETENKEENSAKIRVDSFKGKHRVEEIRVNIKSLDRLFNLAGELVLAKSRLVNLAKHVDSPEMKDIQRFIEGVISELQTEVMGLRLMPVGQVFGIFPRMVRDMSKELGKEVDLVIQGGETAVDRKVVEEVVDAMVHLIRNCLDHGIETPEERIKAGKQTVGTIRLSASRDSSHFVLEIEDDGRGMDPVKIREIAVAKGIVSEKKASEMDDEEVLYLTCVPGFSTKKCVSEVSGRGMGMSAVKNKIESYGGSFSIASKIGQGTKFTIRLPASMTTMKVIVIGVGKESHRYAIPVADISEIVEISKEEIKFIQGAPYINLRGDIIRLYRLAWLLKIDEGVCDSYYAIIIKRSEGRGFGLLVSEIRDEDEVAIKPVPKLLRGTSGLIGSTILGDGKPAFVLDVMSIV